MAALDKCRLCGNPIQDCSCADKIVQELANLGMADYAWRDHQDALARLVEKARKYIGKRNS